METGDGIDLTFSTLADIETTPGLMNGVNVVVMTAEPSLEHCLNFLSDIQTVIQATAYAIICSQVVAKSLELEIPAQTINPEVNYQTGIKNFLTEIKVAEGHERIKGDLGTMSCIDLVQNFCRQGTSKQFEINNREGTAILIVNLGQVHHCSIGSLQGRDAFDMIIGWNSGKFETQPVDLEKYPHNVTDDWESLLLDAVRKKDESTFLSDASPL